jgi:hypothetical protein
MYIDTQHQVNIRLKFGELKPILTWCEKNCRGEWKFTLKTIAGLEAGEYNFYFQDDNDKFNFILWQK